MNDCIKESGIVMRMLQHGDISKANTKITNLLLKF